MTSSKRAAVEKSFIALLRSFKIEDIKASVIPVFNDLVTWKQLKEAVLYYNLTFKSSDISKLLVHLLKDKSMVDLVDIYNNTLLVDVMINNNRKTWTTIIMKRPNHIPPETEWTRNIISSFRRKSMNVHVYSSIKDDLRWFVIIVIIRTRNKGVVNKKPIFLAVSLKSPYLFLSPKNVSSDLLKTVVNSLGYDDLRTCNLNGKNINSHLLMLERKKNASKIKKTLSEPDNNIDVIRSRNGYNLNREKDRFEHAAELIGNGIVLDSYNINIKSEWRGVQTIPELEGTSFDSSITLRSKNVAESIKELAECGAISYPFPPWVNEFSLTGKNSITIGNKE